MRGCVHLVVVVGGSGSELTAVLPLVDLGFLDCPPTTGRAKTHRSVVCFCSTAWSAAPFCFVSLGCSSPFRGAAYVAMPKLVRELYYWYREGKTAPPLIDSLRHGTCAGAGVSPVLATFMKSPLKAQYETS